MLRTTIARQARLFTTAPRLQKSTVEAVKDTAVKADKTVSEKIVQGIELGGKSMSAWVASTRSR